MKVGIFDSGLGGHLVAARLRHLAPQFIYRVVDDVRHAPYGSRTPDDIRQLTDSALQPLIRECPIVIIACNTATAAAIDWLRSTYTTTHFIGFEPMIKPANLASRSRHITLLATAATATSQRTKALIDAHGRSLLIDTPPTYGWATMIDAKQAGEIDLREVANSVARGSDTIVLGCTHYLALQDRLTTRFPTAEVIEPTAAVARQLVRVATNLQTADNSHQSARGDATKMGASQTTE